MWDKHFRFLVFNSIYNSIFWTQNINDGEQDLKDLYELAVNTTFNPDELTLAPNFESVKIQVSKYIESKDSFDLLLSKYLEKSGKTYNIVKAVFYTFLLEIEEVDDKTSIVGKYIRLVQEMIGGESTSLVHAVLSKIVTEEK